MSRPNQIRKNLQNREAREPQHPGLAVTQNQNVKAFQKDPRGILNALNTFGEMARQDAAEDKQAELANLAQQGIRDAELGAVDAELQLQSDTYRKASNTQMGMLAGMDFISDARADMPRAFEEARDQGETLDLDDWLQERKQALYEDREDTDELGGINRYVTQAEQQLRGQYAAMRGAAEDQQAVDTFNGIIANQFKEDNLKSPADLHMLANMGDEVGLTNNEIETSIMDMAIQGLQDNNTDFHDTVVEFYGKKKDVMGRWSNKLDDARRAADIRIDTEDFQKEKVADELKLKAWENHRADIQSGQFDVSKLYGDMNEGLFSNGGAQSLIRENEGRLNAQLKEAQEAQDAAAKDFMLSRALLSGNPDNINLLINTGEFKEKDFQDTLDKQLAGLTIQMGQVEADSPEYTQLVDKSVSWVKAMRDQGMVSSGMKRQFEVATTANPEYFKKTYQLFERMRQEGLTDYMGQTMSGEQYSKFRLVGLLNEAGQDVDQVIQYMDGFNGSLQDAEKAIGSVWRNIEETAKGKADGASGYLQANQILRGSVSTYILQGATPTQALDLASEDFDKLYHKVGGVLMRKESGWDDKSMDLARDEYVTRGLKDKLGDHFDGDAVYDYISSGKPGVLFVIQDGQLVPGVSVSPRDIASLRLQLTSEQQVRNGQVEDVLRKRKFTTQFGART